MEGVTGYIWCNASNSVQIDSWFTAQCRDVIWSWKVPSISRPTISFGYAQFQLKLEHNGDIQDEECILIILMKMSNQFDDVIFRIETGEGDFIMFETIQFLNTKIREKKIDDKTAAQCLTEIEDDLNDEVSIVSQGMIYHIPELISNSPDLPNKIKDANKSDEKATKFSKAIQDSFKEFLKSIENQELYHNKTLLIPKGLRRLLIYDPSLISKVVPKAHFSKTFNKDFEFEEHRIKFRRFHFGLLDSMDIRIPREFGNLCEDKPLRYIKLSYLLTIAYQDILKSQELKTEIEHSQDSDFDSLMGPEEKITDDDENWIDEAPKPEFNYEDVGEQMAERVGEFMHEMSQYDHIEADGPINFDIDIFKNKLENFLNSSSDSEEEEEEEDIDHLMEYLDDKDEKLLRVVADGKAPAKEYVNKYLDQSYNSQPSEQGPTSDLMQLFNLK